MGLPEKQGLYDPGNEHDNCGIGFVANIKGVKSRDIIQRGLEVLINMTHRGAESSDNKSGDGAGILIQIPDSLYRSRGIILPDEGSYGTGLIFLPADEEKRKACEDMMEGLIKDEGLDLIAFEDVKVDSSVLGEIARSTEPFIRQVFIGGNIIEQEVLERKLYIIRKLCEKKVTEVLGSQSKEFYIVSLSSKIIVYKGMFIPEQLPQYYLDLQDPASESAIALIHSRFSTNTFPTWDLAQPFRMLAHNGEINTIKGNRMWMKSREPIMKSDLFGENLKKLFPVIEEGKSDSASLDNALEFLVQTGKSIPHALSMLVPESWNDKNPISPGLKAYYEFNSTFMEPWDGPASLLFTDGRCIGGTLDRNGLRPSRYLVTTDDMIVMGSETGVQVFPPEKIKIKGRLKPGKILLVDTRMGVIVPDEELKTQLKNRQPYRQWLDDKRIDLEDIIVKERVPSSLGEDYQYYLDSFGYSKEDLDLLIKPMAQNGQEPTSSMGNDTSLAIFSEKPQRLFSYFKQLFAQVTNPPIDPIREGLVMSLTNYIGSVSKNILSESPDLCKLIKYKSPLVSNTNLNKLRNLREESFEHTDISILFDSTTDNPGSTLKNRISEICLLAEKAVDNGVNFIILSDRGVGRDKAAIPSLLAISAVHHHLINVQKRMQVALVLESAEPREVHHFALLIGYGASMVNPYAAYAIIQDLCKKDKISLDYVVARENYIKAVNKGLLKILSKMGISTLRSYLGAQIFEAVGLNEEFIHEYFEGTFSRIGGLGIDQIATETLIPHKRAFSKFENQSWQLKSNGVYNYRTDGEKHGWNPETVGLLQWAVRQNSYDKYQEFSTLVNEENRQPLFLRGCMNIKKGKAIAIEEVEPVENIVKRFVTGAMSYGSISKEAHEALAVAMNRLGGKSNTGEGGENPERFTPREDGTLARSAIKQVASGRFGVTASYLVNADEIQIKVAQGAKPGEGGQLPGFKVDSVIAGMRNSTPGITLISPPPHHDIYSIEDLAQLIYDLKNVNPSAKISVKLVSERGVGTIAAGVAKAHASGITISGFEGGTGASPASSIRHAGLPMELGIADAHQTLMLNKLRDRVTLQTDGQLKTGRDVVIAGMLGAEEFGFATSSLIALGCVMMRKCHLNTCPVGVATQDPELRKKFNGRAEFVVNYFSFIAQEIRELLAASGFRTFSEIVGRTDLLEKRDDIENWKAKHIDLSAILYQPFKGRGLPSKSEEKELTNPLDELIVKKVTKNIHARQKTWVTNTITNTDRATGAMLSGYITKKHGSEGLPQDTINAKFIGSAGQSFGAFLTKGVSFTLEGDSNDYLGKGLSGGKIVVFPQPGTNYQPEKNIIVGNTLLYGATAGETYIRGVAGERFCVRNSGAIAVVEGVGDHCCEYMTGGRTVVLGETGRNFAAGMSGGIAYVLDLKGNFNYFCNPGLVELGKVDDKESEEELQDLISKHFQNTRSELAEKILVNWEEYLQKFVMVIPLEYKKILQEEKLVKLRKQLESAEDEPHFQY